MWIIGIIIGEKSPRTITPLDSGGISRTQRTFKKGAAFKSYGEIVEWLKKEYDLELTYATVYAWVHYRLQAKLKVPCPQSALQDVKAVGLFKKHRPSSLNVSKFFW